MLEICNLDMLTIKIIENVITRQGIPFNSNLEIYKIKVIDVCKRRCRRYIQNFIIKDEKIKRFISKVFIEEDIQILEDGKVILTTDIYSEMAKYFLRLNSNMKVITDNIREVMKCYNLITNAIEKGKFLRIIPSDNLNQISRIDDVDYEIFQIFLKIIVFTFSDNKRKDKLYHLEKVVDAIEIFWPGKLKMIVNNEYIEYSEFIESVVFSNFNNLKIQFDCCQIMYLKELNEFLD